MFLVDNYLDFKIQIVNRTYHNFIIESFLFFLK